MRLEHTVSFLHKAKIRKVLEDLPDGASLTVKGDAVRYLDEEVSQLFKDFQSTASDRSITLDTSGINVRDPMHTGPHPTLPSREAS